MDGSGVPGSGADGGAGLDVGSDVGGDTAARFGVDIDVQALDGFVGRLRDGARAARDAAGALATVPEVHTAGDDGSGAAEVSAALRRCIGAVGDAVEGRADALDEGAESASAAGRALTESDASVARDFAAVEDRLG